MAISKRKIWSLLNSVLWTVLSLSVVFLLVAATQQNRDALCKGMVIRIGVNGEHYFISEDDVKLMIKKELGTPVKGTPVKNINIRAIENSLSKNEWVNSARIFIDNNNVLQILINERAPVARIFSMNGNSFYIDSALHVLPLSDDYAPRLPVFTSYKYELAGKTPYDSLMLSSIRLLSSMMQQDSFLTAFIDQVDITPSQSFKLYPKIGRTVIDFGDTTNAEDKFRKLKLFYKNVIPAKGWDKYNLIDLNFSGQVVARIKDKQDIAADSLRAKQIRDMIANYSAQMAEDSSRLNSDISEKIPNDLSMILESTERDEEDADSNVKVLIPATVPIFTTAPKPLPATVQAATAVNPGVSNAPTPPAAKAIAKPVKPNVVATKPAATPKPATSNPKAVVKPAAKPAPPKVAAPKAVAPKSAVPKATVAKPIAKPAAKPKVVMPAKPENDY